MQKARSHTLKCSYRLQAYGFRYSFTPLFEVLFTFPSRYLFTIGLSGVFSLTRWSWLIHTEFLVFRATQDTTRFKLLTCTRLSLSLACLSKQFHFTHIIISQSYNPTIAETIMVWANPRSIATTWGITFVFFSSGYLDVSVLRVCLLFRISFRMGCPIQKSTDQWLFAPPRSLSQLITSFFASESLGIRHTPLITSFCANKSINFHHEINRCFFTLVTSTLLLSICQRTF